MSPTPCHSVASELPSEGVSLSLHAAEISDTPQDIEVDQKSKALAALEKQREKNRRTNKTFRRKHSAAAFRKLITERDAAVEEVLTIKKDLRVACKLVSDLRKQLAAAKTHSEDTSAT